MKCCDKYAPALSALVDGELSDAERAEVLAHLETCEGCRAYLAELSAMHATLGEMEEYDAPEGFADGVMARLHETAAPKKRSHRTAWMSLAACAALAVVVLGTPLREQFGAAKPADSAVPETAMLTMAAPQMAECAEEEYEDEFASVQNAPMTMMTCDSAAPAEEKATLGANDYAAGAAAELPRSVVFVFGAAREDYLIEAATSFDYYADGTVAGYDLPVEQLDEFLALLDADGALHMERASLAAYAHGDYFALGKKLGTFGDVAAMSLMRSDRVAGKLVYTRVAQTNFTR